MKRSKFQATATRTGIALVLTVASLGLTGCSLLYPNWGQTGLPTDSAIPTVLPSDNPSSSQSEQPSASPTTVAKQPASVQITMSNVDATSGTIGVVAQVTNVAEDGGFCTFKLTSGSSSKTLVVKAESNVSTTQCYPMEVTLTGFPKGNATLTVSYDSVGFSGVSPAQVVNIP